MSWPFDLPYSVELWDDADSHVEELIALTGDYRVARAAFDEAVKCRPGRIVTLGQKTERQLPVHPHTMYSRKVELHGSQYSR